jgi:hypothetical protein
MYEHHELTDGPLKFSPEDPECRRDDTVAAVTDEFALQHVERELSANAARMAFTRRNAGSVVCAPLDNTSTVAGKRVCAGHFCSDGLARSGRRNGRCRRARLIRMIFPAMTWPYCEGNARAAGSLPTARFGSSQPRVWNAGTLLHDRSLE